MRRALRSAFRAAEALMPPARAEAAPPASRVPPAAALAMARALSGASGSSFVGAPGSASEPSAPPAADAAAAEPLVAAAASSRKEMYMVFTCGRCETRAVKGFSRQAYEHGVVLVDCPGCEARHLVADRKGWFGDKGSVEDFLAERGEAVARRGGAGEDSLEITAEELAGWSAAGPPKDAA